MAKRKKRHFAKKHPFGCSLHILWVKNLKVYSFAGHLKTVCSDIFNLRCSHRYFEQTNKQSTAIQADKGFPSFFLQTSSKQRANNQQTIVDDGDEEVNGFDLDDDIDSGALVLLTSLDHDNWHLKDKYLDICDSIKDGSATKSFETNEVELSNGCYYKVIVAYKMEKKKSNSISQNRCGCFYPQLMTPKKAPALCYANAFMSYTYPYDRPPPRRLNFLLIT